MALPGKRHLLAHSHKGLRHKRPLIQDDHHGRHETRLQLVMAQAIDQRNPLPLPARSHCRLLVHSTHSRPLLARNSNLNNTLLAHNSKLNSPLPARNSNPSNQPGHNHHQPRLAHNNSLPPMLHNNSPSSIFHKRNHLRLDHNSLLLLVYNNHSMLVHNNSPSPDNSSHHFLPDNNRSMLAHNSSPLLDSNYLLQGLKRSNAEDSQRGQQHLLLD